MWRGKKRERRVIRGVLTWPFCCCHQLFWPHQWIEFEKSFCTIYCAHLVFGIQLRLLLRWTASLMRYTCNISTRKRPSSKSQFAYRSHNILLAQQCHQRVSDITPVIEAKSPRKDNQCTCSTNDKASLSCHCCLPPKTKWIIKRALPCALRIEFSERSEVCLLDKCFKGDKNQHIVKFGFSGIRMGLCMHMVRTVWRLCYGNPKKRPTICDCKSTALHLKPFIIYANYPARWMDSIYKLVRT